jgi:hypothetical protein
MTPTDPEFAQPKEAKRPWFRFSRRNVFLFTLLFVGCGIGFAFRSRGPDYDRQCYNQIRRAIEADKQHFLGKPLDEFVRKLGLENVPWNDDGPTQNEPGSDRYYHFRGFALYVTLERLPAGITPGMTKGRSLTSEELQRPVVPWLARNVPFVLIDGISDGEERMRRFWRWAEEECERINKKM